MGPSAHRPCVGPVVLATSGERPPTPVVLPVGEEGDREVGRSVGVVLETDRGKSIPGTYRVTERLERSPVGSPRVRPETVEQRGGWASLRPPKPETPEGDLPVTVGGHGPEAGGRRVADGVAPPTVRRLAVVASDTVGQHAGSYLVRGTPRVPLPRRRSYPLDRERRGGLCVCACVSRGTRRDAHGLFPDPISGF